MDEQAIRSRKTRRSIQTMAQRLSIYPKLKVESYKRGITTIKAIDEAIRLLLKKWQDK
jgi:hypothetical protein